MNADSEPLLIFLHLAWAAGRRRRPLDRCRMLLLAADEALHLGMLDIAEYCRLEMLRISPGHLVSRFQSFAEARRSEDLESLLRRLRRRYARERAEQMLDRLGLDVAGGRGSYESDEEYAAGILGESLESLKAAVSRSPSRDDRHRQGDQGNRTRDDQGD